VQRWFLLSGSVETTMINRKVDKAEWKQFFDFLSKQVEGTHAEIEVASLKLDDQIEAEWLPLIGLVYDRKDIGGNPDTPYPRSRVG
jgi:hypothetical protein